jgi:nucleoside-diphosphate-sugar epimerase
MKVTIIGCGYTGQVLAPLLVSAGHDVSVTTTTDQNHAALSLLGVTPKVLRQEQELDAYRAVLASTEGLVYLAPPSPEIKGETIVDKIVQAAPALEVCVYGSTTGVYGKPNQVDQWIDEDTTCGPRNPRSERRADMEDAFNQSNLNTKILRIAGIYGPGRSLAARVQNPNWPLFEGAPSTSRIHVHDLAHLLQEMLRMDAPSLVNGCDEHPCPTLEVAQYTADLLSISLPPLVSPQEAQANMSAMAWSFRSGGRRCRSLYRDKLVKRLKFPTYREGVKASLEAEGLI